MNTLPKPIESDQNAKKLSKGLATALAFFLGSVGAHSFYLGNMRSGIVRLLFCWTMIPGLIGLYDALMFAAMDPLDFDLEHNRAFFSAAELQAMEVKAAGMSPRLDGRRVIKVGLIRGLIKALIRM